MRIKAINSTLKNNVAEIILVSEDTLSSTTLTSKYFVYGNGAVQISQKIDIADSTISEIPRFGMKFSMLGNYDKVSWFGRGPHESYWDRKTSAVAAAAVVTVRSSPCRGAVLHWVREKFPCSLFGRVHSPHRHCL